MLQGRRSLLLLVFSVYLIGCTSVNQGLPIPQLTFTPTVKVSTLPIKVAPYPLQTSVKGITPVPILTESSTHIPTINLTPLPTLESAEADNAIKQFFTQNKPCQSPCFLGIIPDQTTLEQAQEILTHLNMPLVLTYQESDKQYYASGRIFDEGYGISIMNIVQEGIARNIEVGIGLNNSNGNLNRDAPEFQLISVINQNGAPSEIEYDLSFPVEYGFAPGTAWYNIIMYFESSNLIIEYGYELANAVDTIRSCPLTDRLEGISMWFGKTPRTAPFRQVPVLDATGVSVHQFNNLITHDADEVCFNLNPQAFLSK